MVHKRAGPGMVVQQEVEAMAAVRQQAEEHGVNEKSHGVHGWAGSMMRKFERFLEKHGARLGYVAAVGPSIEIVKHFVDYCSSGAGRESFSCVGRPGCATSTLSCNCRIRLRNGCLE